MWTDSTGKFKIEARFQSETDGKVRLLKKNGMFAELPREQLSPEDREWIDKR